jgi:hypothetical protein
MSSNVSRQDCDESVEDLLRIRNCLIDLGAEKFAKAADRAKKLILALRELADKKMPSRAP